MPNVFDKLTNWMRRKPRPTPEPEPEGLYSPAERGGMDPTDPPAFNVGNEVVAAGSAQSGAVAVGDERRRALQTPVVIQDGTKGEVRAVDLKLLFVAVPLRVPIAAFQTVRSKGDDVELSLGDKVRAIGPVKALDQDATVPAGQHAWVERLWDDREMTVKTLFQFPKEDWHNLVHFEDRRWGLLAVSGPRQARRLLEVGGRSAAGVIDVHELAKYITDHIVEALVTSGGLLTWALKTLDETLGNAIMLGDMLHGPDLQSEAATDEMAETRFYAAAIKDEAKGWFTADETGFDSAVVINLARFDPRDGRGRLWRDVYGTVTHELRHAADWAYKVTGTGRQKTVKEWKGSDGLTPADYANHPAERLTTPGNAAEALWQHYGAQLPSGDDLSGAIGKLFPLSLELRPENRKRWLQRVIKAHEQLVTRRTGARIPYQTDSRSGEIELLDVKPGDRVRLNDDEPVAVVTKVYDTNLVAKSNEGAGKRVRLVPAETVLLLHDRDPRIALL